MKLLHKNSLSGVGQLVLTAGLTFFSIPIFIRTLGDEAYGAFSIVTLAGNLNIFANLGLNTALLKFLSVQGKSKESDHDIALTLGLLLLIMVPLSTLAIYQQSYILQSMLGMSTKLYNQVATLYRCVVVANLIILLGQTFTTVLDSQQRMYLTNFYQLIYSILYWGGLIVVVSLGYGLPEIGFIILAAAIIWFSLVLIAAWRIWGWLQLEGLRVNLVRVARKQISFSSKVYAAGLLTMLFEPMTKVLVARLIGVREVGYLEIAYKVRSQLWALVTKVTYPIYPKIARENDSYKLSQLLGGYQTGMLLVMMPFLLFLSIALPDLFLLWLPTTTTIIVTATLYISATFVINSLSIPPYYFLMSRQYVGKTVWIQLTNVGVNLLVILLTYRIMGIYGFILGNSIAILTSMVLCLYYQKKYLGKLAIDTTHIRRFMIIILPVSGIALVSNSLLHESWLRLGVIVILTVILYGLLLRNSYKMLKSIAI
jgi:O-antigen/teichoic acid export membrane protein